MDFRYGSDRRQPQAGAVVVLFGKRDYRHSDNWPRGRIGLELSRILPELNDSINLKIEHSIMKKLIYLTVMTIMIVSMTACGGDKAESKLKQSIEEAQSDLPLDLGMLGDLTDLKYDESDKSVKMYMTLNENIMSVEAMKENSANMKKMFKLGMSGEGPRELIKMIADAGASLSVRYKGGNSGKTLELTVSNSELQDILNTDLAEEDKNRMMLEGSVANFNASCPINLGSGLVAKSASLEGNDVIYVYEADEEVLDLGMMRLNEDNIRKELVKQFGDPSVKNDLSMMASAGCDVVYRYVGDTSGDMFEFRFTNSELKKHLSH